MVVIWYAQFLKISANVFLFFYFLVSHIQNIFCVVVDRHLYSFIHSSKFCANLIWKYKCCFDVSVEATLHAVILQIEAIDFQFYMRQWYRTIIALRTICIFFLCVCSLLWRKTLCEQLSNACFSTDFCDSINGFAVLIKRIIVVRAEESEIEQHTSNLNITTNHHQLCDGICFKRTRVLRSVDHFT